jgi:putative transposase
VMLEKFLSEHQIKMGRDALFDLLAAHCLLIRKKKRRITTTQSFHWLRKYPNYIQNIIPARRNHIWVSDITYYQTTKGFTYISFITDAYSRKIVGYHAADTLEAIHTIKALKMAIEQSPEPLTELIHHSDRGVQYCCSDYVKLLQDNQIKISMTENGNPLENAIAERVNGIIKEEFLNHYSPKNQAEIMELLQQSVSTYNTQRPHMSCSMLTPDNVHQNNLAVRRTWQNYYKQKPTFVNPLQD